MTSLRAFFFAAAAFSFLSTPGSAANLYYTDFENFTVGADRWVGTEGWLGNNTNAGVHGIDNEIVPGLGKTAYIGYRQPRSTLVAVLRPVNYSPVAAGRPIVEFETLLGIQDSTNGHRDSFFFSLYNTNGNFLAAVRFSNEDLTHGVWRSDGTNQHDTGIDFTRNDLHLLYAQVDFSSNRWSADLDGIPLFTNAIFNATERPLTLGSVSAEWQLSSTVTNHGDNWMLVADWMVRAAPRGENPFLVRSNGVSEAGNSWLSWNGQAGFGYRVDYSEDWQSWQTNLASGLYTSTATAGPIVFTDTNAVAATNRFYRLSRWASP